MTHRGLGTAAVVVLDQCIRILEPLAVVYTKPEPAIPYNRTATDKYSVSLLQRHPAPRFEKPRDHQRCAFTTLLAMYQHAQTPAQGRVYHCGSSVEGSA